jgi:hypothetical protein
MKKTLLQTIIAPIAMVSVVAGVFFGIYGDEAEMSINVVMSLLIGSVYARSIR